MKLRGRLVTIMAGLLVVGMTTMAVVSQRRNPNGRVISLSTVYTGLRLRPKGWVGKTVLVQGRENRARRTRLYSPQHICLPFYSPAGAGQYVFAQSKDEPPIHGTPADNAAFHLRAPRWEFSLWLRGVPVVGQLVPERWGRVGQEEIFRLTLLPRNTCPVGVCATNPDALLDDVYG